MGRSILTCEEDFGVDCAPGVCARVFGQRNIARKQISGRARFILTVLNGGICILHRDRCVSSLNVPPLTGFFVVAGENSHPDRVGVGYDMSSLRDIEAFVDRPAREYCPLPPHLHPLFGSLICCFLA